MITTNVSLVVFGLFLAALIVAICIDKIFRVEEDLVPPSRKRRIKRKKRLARKKRINEWIKLKV